MNRDKKIEVITELLTNAIDPENWRTSHEVDAREERLELMHEHKHESKPENGQYREEAIEIVRIEHLKRLANLLVGDE